MTTESITTDIEATIDAYLAAYGETDPSRRMALIRQAWAADGQLVDPPIEGAGHDGLDAMFATVQGQFPGHTFRRSTAVDSHHGIARYGWQLVAADGSITLTGMDVAELDESGTLQRVAGFFGELSPV